MPSPLLSSLPDPFSGADKAVSGSDGIAIKPWNENFAAHTLMRNGYFSCFGARTIGYGIKIDACYKVFGINGDFCLTMQRNFLYYLFAKRS